MKFTPDNKITVEKSELVILAVKPKIIPFVLDDLYPYINDKHLLLSFAAGVNIASIEKVYFLIFSLSQWLAIFFSVYPLAGYCYGCIPPNPKLTSDFFLAMFE